ncbi:MAG: hypothetical protein ACYTBP_11980 [Planctomycetota bacterium]|jgi:hypothetical protein
MDELNNKTSRNKSEILNDNSNHNSITKPFFYSILSICFAILGFIIFAIAIMWDGFLGIFVKYSFLLSAILGVIALTKIRHYKSKPLLKDVVITSVSLSIIFLSLQLFCYGLPVFKEYAFQMRKVGDMKLSKLGKAVIQYANNHDGYLPDANEWCDLLIENNPALKREDFMHPFIKGFECNFAFNKNLDGLKLEDVPNDVVLLFLADGDWNLSGGPELLTQGSGLPVYILFPNQDICVYSIKRKGYTTYDPNSKSWAFKQLRWEP